MSQRLKIWLNLILSWTTIRKPENVPEKTVPENVPKSGKTIWEWSYSIRPLKYIIVAFYLIADIVW